MAERLKPSCFGGITVKMVFHTIMLGVMSALSACADNQNRTPDSPIGHESLTQNTMPTTDRRGNNIYNGEIML